VPNARAGIAGAILAAAVIVSVSTVSPAAAQERVLGADISYWNCGSSSTGISQANWNLAFTAGQRRFVFIRATRGGTTGVDQPQGTPGGGASSTLSRRYDDPRFVQNITRATAAGMLAGPYHFARPDVAGNTGADEADHFIQMAGAWMRPGYLMPICDLEAGAGGDALAQFAIDFSNRINAVLRIRPGIYINGNYSSILQGATAARRDLLAKPVAYTPSVTGPAFPMLWNARYSDNGNPSAIPVQTGSPKHTYTTYAGYYGPWDDYGNADPWSFWQYASTVSIPGFAAVDGTVDGNVAHGDIEDVRNSLVPAVWWSDRSGDWSVLTNWNSGQPVTAPVTPPDQATPYATGPLPVPRLPGAPGSGPTSGQHDTVIIERPAASVTVTVSAGIHIIRKLYLREALNLTGGSLTINYNPHYRADDSPHVRHAGPVSAQFSGPVSIGGNARLAVHTLQVDASRVLTLAGGTLAFETIRLMPHATAPARILVTGNASVNPWSDATAVIARGAGAGTSGYIDLGGDMREIAVGDGSSEVDLSIDVSLANGGLSKTGPGTLRLASASTYAGGTTVSGGRLLVTNPAGSGTGVGGVTVVGGTLGGTGVIAGAVTIDREGTLAPGVSIGTLTLQSPPALGGVLMLEIDRNGGAPVADRIVLTTGTLDFGGTLVVTNVGAVLTGGEMFRLFVAPACAGAFADWRLPPLGAGLNWFMGALVADGTIAVNRAPVPGDLPTLTNVAPALLEIPLALLTGSATDADGDALFVSGVASASTNGIPLGIHGEIIVYANDASVADEFNYTLSDGRGGSATGVVRIVNIGAKPPAVFVGPPSVSGGAVLLRFSASPGRTYDLERSTDLVHWRTIWTGVAPAGAMLEYTDEFRDLHAPPAAAFYRVR
jgi:autotransporter-associated beta strand protein